MEPYLVKSNLYRVTDILDVLSDEHTYQALSRPSRIDLLSGAICTLISIREAEQIEFDTNSNVPF